MQPFSTCAHILKQTISSNIIVTVTNTNFPFTLFKMRKIVENPVKRNSPKQYHTLCYIISHYNITITVFVQIYEDGYNATTPQRAPTKIIFRKSIHHFQICTWVISIIQVENQKVFSFNCLTNIIRIEFNAHRPEKRGYSEHLFVRVCCLQNTLSFPSTITINVYNVYVYRIFVCVVMSVSYK